MILAGPSVWIDHLRQVTRRSPRDAAMVLAHRFVIGNSLWGTCVSAKPC